MTQIYIAGCEKVYLNVTNCSRLKELKVYSHTDVRKIAIKNCPKLLPSNGFGIPKWESAEFYSYYMEHDMSISNTADLIYEDQQYVWDWKQFKWILSTETAS